MTATKGAQKKPNPWGLYDMHGNVAEWVLDQYDEAGYETVADQTQDPLAIPMVLNPRVVRGGGWNQFPEECRSAARQPTTEEWRRQDPQIPKSIWYLTDAARRLPDSAATGGTQRAGKSRQGDKSEPVQVERVGPKANINN